MAGRRISFSRVLDFFREADADEVRAIMPLVLEAVQRRKLSTTLATGTRRTRRTKAEMAQSRLNGPEAVAGA